MKAARYVVLVWVLFAMRAEAATLYFDPPNANLNRGDAVTMAVRLDTDEAAGECVNAIDGVITYSENVIPVDISLGDSILPVWVEMPTINKDTRTITFAGGIPNGYCGRVEGDPQLTNKLVEIVFRSPGLQVGGSPAGPVATIEFAPESQVYLNDGLGTVQTPMLLPATLTLSNEIGSEIADPWRTEVAEDTVPPEPFSIALEQNNSAFEGKYYIVFNTTDKQTGLSRYEVMEQPHERSNFFNFGAATAPWHEERSPYELEDQSLTSTIFVRAIDKAGNEYVAKLDPQNSPFNFDPRYVWGAVAGVAFLVTAMVVWLMVRFFRRRRMHREVAANASTSEPVKSEGVHESDES